MNFFRAFYITGATSVLVTIIAFFNNVIVTRFLGPEKRGKYSIAINIVMIFALILGEGLRRGNVILVGKEKLSVSKVVNRTFVYVLLLALLFSMIIFFQDNFLESLLKIEPRLIILALYLTVLLIFWRSLQSIFLGLEDYKRFNLIQFIYTLLIFIFNLFVIFIYKGSLNEIILSFLFSSIVIVFLSLFWIKQLNVNGEEKRKNEADNLILKATIASVFGFILLKGDIFFVNYFTNSTNTGIYSITLVVTELFQKLPLILGPIVISRSANKNEKLEIINVSKLSRVLAFINFLAALFVLLFGKEIIIFFFSNKFSTSYDLLVFILPSLLFFSSGHIINAFFMGRGFPKIVVVNAVVFSTLNIALNFFLIPKYGTQAAAFNCSLSYLLWSFSFIFYFSNKYKISLLDMLIINKQDVYEIKSKIFANG